jgi:protein-tyrosine-phosphatase
LAEDEIIDPFGKSKYHYRLAEAQITVAIENLVEKLISK